MKAFIYYWGAYVIWCSCWFVYAATVTHNPVSLWVQGICGLFGIGMFIWNVERSNPFRWL